MFFIKTVEGYVCIAKVMGTGAEFLYGRNTDKSLSSSPYKNIETQENLSFYKTKKEAEQGLSQIKKMKDLGEFRVAKLSMKVAETKEDLEDLVNEKSLITIQKSDGLNLFLGPITKDRKSAYPLPGAYLGFNGFKTHDNFKDAEYLMQEVRRQGWCHATLAAFYLEFL